MHEQGTIVTPRCHFHNPDMSEALYTPQERVCQLRDGHDRAVYAPNPHAGVVGRSRWVYPPISMGSPLPAPAGGKDAWDLIRAMEHYP